jgi:FixJ family two-component response regulator
MALVTAGKLNKQIAGELGLSEVTINFHRGAGIRRWESIRWQNWSAWRIQ